MSKLGLGTAQFGMDYGINNQTGKIPKPEAFKILQTASENNISIIDTASAYGESEEVIGEFLSQQSCKEFKIVAKYSGYNNISLENECLNSIKKLNLKNIYGYLIHNFSTFLENKKHIINSLKNIKEIGLTQKTGFSLYTTDELEYLLSEKINFEIVQLPYNIFDRRFEKYFSILKEKNIEIHTRSVFLQGIVFKNTNSLNAYFNKFIPKIELLQRISKNASISITSICLNFVCSHKLIDSVIIGVNNLDNLLQNIQNLYEQEITTKDINFDELEETNTKFILPSNWELT